jgi:hypothetical protein
MVAGAANAGNEGWGVVLALRTVSTLITLALTFRDLFLLGVGSIGTLIILPDVMGPLLLRGLGPGACPYGFGGPAGGCRRSDDQASR